MNWKNEAHHVYLSLFFSFALLCCTRVTEVKLCRQEGKELSRLRLQVKVLFTMLVVMC